MKVVTSVKLSRMHENVERHIIWLIEKIKRRKKNGKTNEEEQSLPNHSGMLISAVAFRATFGSTVRQTVCPDVVADGNLMENALHVELQQRNSKMNTEILSKTVSYKMSKALKNGTTAQVKCQKNIALNVKLHITLVKTSGWKVLLDLLATNVCANL